MLFWNVFGTHDFYPRLLPTPTTFTHTHDFYPRPTTFTHDPRPTTFSQTHKIGLDSGVAETGISTF